RARLRLILSGGPSMLALLAVVAVVAAFALGYWLGRTRSATSATSGTRDVMAADTPVPVAPSPGAVAAPAPPAPLAPAASASAITAGADQSLGERGRLIRSYENESAMLRRAMSTQQAQLEQLDDLAEDRRRLYPELARAQAETARYRELVVSLEDNA